MSALNQQLQSGYIVERSPPLRPPAPQELAELLRRHHAGETAVMRLSGDLGWTSLVGVNPHNRGITESPAEIERERIANPRAALRAALAMQREISGRLGELTRLRAEAEAAEREATAALDALAESETSELLAWAEDRTRPKPDIAGQRTELMAQRVLAVRKSETARAACAEAEVALIPRHMHGRGEVEKLVTQVLLDEAEQLAGAYAAHVKAAVVLEAAMQGIRQGFVQAKDGFNAAFVQRLLTGGDAPVAERERAAVRRQAEAVRERFARYGDRLRFNPAAREEPLG